MQSNEANLPAHSDQGSLFDSADSSIGLTSFAQARTDAAQGMSRALSSARSIDPDWPEKAYEFLRRFAANKEYFVSEEVSALSQSLGMSQPKTLKSWGAIYARAARDNLIGKVGSGISRNRHMSLCPLWKSLCYQGGQEGSEGLLDSHLDPALPQAVHGFLRLSLRYDAGISKDYLLMKIERFEEPLDAPGALGSVRALNCIETQMHACKALPTESDEEQRVTYLREMVDLLGKTLTPGRTLITLSPAIRAMVSSWNILGVFKAIEDIASHDRPRRVASHTPEHGAAQREPLAMLSREDAELLVVALAHYAVSLDEPSGDLVGLSDQDRSVRTDRSLDLMHRFASSYGVEISAQAAP